MDGYLLVNKHKGPTSHDIVNDMRRVFRTKKVGHTGTLDPLATGLMVILVGKATKAADYIIAEDKSYVATMRLGTISDTLDITGELTVLEHKEISDEQIKETLKSFVGKQEQIPPMYSAKKVDGKKLYELAREGKEIARKPTQIEIYDIEFLSRDGDDVKFSVHCSKGTYVRSVIDDFGKKLGYGAIMTSLERTQTGNFRLDKHRVYTVSEVERCKDLKKLLFPLDMAFSKYPRIVMDEISEERIKNGIPYDLKRGKLKVKYKVGDIFRVYNQRKEFFALMEVMPKDILKLKTTFFVQ